MLVGLDPVYPPRPPISCHSPYKRLFLSHRRQHRQARPSTFFLTPQPLDHTLFLKLTGIALHLRLPYSSNPYLTPTRKPPLVSNIICNTTTMPTPQYRCPRCKVAKHSPRSLSVHLARKKLCATYRRTALSTIRQSLHPHISPPSPRHHPLDGARPRRHPHHQVPPDLSGAPPAVSLDDAAAMEVENESSSGGSAADTTAEPQIRSRRVWIEEVDDEDAPLPANRRVIDYHPSGGRAYSNGKRKTSYERRRQDLNGKPPYGSFTSRDDWEHAKWLMTEELSQSAIDRYLKLASVSCSQRTHSIKTNSIERLYRFATASNHPLTTPATCSQRSMNSPLDPNFALRSLLSPAIFSMRTASR